MLAKSTSQIASHRRAYPVDTFIGAKKWALLSVVRVTERMNYRTTEQQNDFRNPRAEG